MHLSERTEYVAPPIENSLLIPVLAPASSCCLGSMAAPLPLMEEITEEATFICDDLDGLLREADEERVRDLQEGPSNLVVRSPPQVGSQEWRLNGIHRMRPGPGRRAQRATCSHPYLRRDSTRRSGELWGPREPRGSAGSSPRSGVGAINIALLRGDEGVPPSSSGRLGLVLQGEELVRPSGVELGLWICDPPEDWSV